MRVLFIASECAPLIKTGGLADVVGALPKALGAVGTDVRVLLPAYPGLLDGLEADGEAIPTRPLFGRRARVVPGRRAGLRLLLLDAPRLFGRPGNPYVGKNGKDWPDNHKRFGALSAVGAWLADGKLPGWRPDVVHAHDWQAGLAPAYLALSKSKTASRSVITVHNIAFQGLFPRKTMAELKLPASGFVQSGFEFYGEVGFLKAGLVYADAITTVSPTYARELTTPEYGMGLEGVIAQRRGSLTGILNGIDLDAWNPASDPDIAVPYDRSQLQGKSKNKAALQRRLGLTADARAPLFCVVSRLTRQKGLDLLLDALPHLLWRGGQLALLGSGDADLEKSFAAAARANPGRVAVSLGYDEPLSHLMQAGADAILIPSRFEPCGLTQLYGLRYGTLPVVAHTGGLADTVIDANDAAIKANCATGFQFAPTTLSALRDALDRACDAFADKRLWRGMQRRAMKHPVGWDVSAAAYAALYQQLAGAPAGAVVP